MGQTEHQRQRLVAPGAQARAALKPAWVGRCTAHHRSPPPLQLGLRAAPRTRVREVKAWAESTPTNPRDKVGCGPQKRERMILTR